MLRNINLVQSNKNIHVLMYVYEYDTSRVQNGSLFREPALAGSKL